MGEGALYMIRSKLRRAAGFTLAELMLAVAIIGVLTGVGIPVLTDSVANSRAETCRANRETAEHAIAVGRMLSDTKEISVPDAIDLVGDLATMCPSGGVCSVVQMGDGVYKINCSKHNMSIGQAFVGGCQTLSLGSGQRIDALSTNSNATKAALTSMGVDLEQLGAKGWTVINPKNYFGATNSGNKLQYVWTDVDLQQEWTNNGNKAYSARAICFVPDYDGGTYIVARSNVNKNDSTSKVVGLAPGAQESGFAWDKNKNKLVVRDDVKTFKTYEEAMAYYNTMPATAATVK